MDLGDFYWEPQLPNGWSLEEIVDVNIKSAIEKFTDDIELIASFDVDQVVLLTSGTQLPKTYTLEKIFAYRLEDWCENSEAEDNALAWVECLEAVIAKIRTAMEEGRAQPLTPAQVSMPRSAQPDHKALGD